MKKLLFILLLTTPVLCLAQRQIYLKCTGENVNVKRGPGTNFKNTQRNGGAHCGFGKAQLYQGEILIWDGQQKNGFYRVYQAYEPCWEDEYGWVSSKFLVRAEKCTACNGKGHTGRQCPQCNGMGVYACCHYTGLELCENCYGIGYW